MSTKKTTQNYKKNSKNYKKLQAYSADKKHDRKKATQSTQNYKQITMSRKTQKLLRNFAKV